MLLEGIGEAIEQSIALTAVVRLLFAQHRQPFAYPQLVEPAPPPRTALKDAMEIGAGHALLHPAQSFIGAERLAGLEAGGAAAVQLEAFDLQRVAFWRVVVEGRPQGLAGALPQGFLAAEHGA